MATDRLSEDRKAQHKKRLRKRRAILALLAGVLVAWLITSALALETFPVARVLLLVLAALVGLHVVFWQLGDPWWHRLPRPFGRALTFVALAASPMMLYPVGLIGLLAAFLFGGAAWPPLVVTGALILSPIAAIILLGIAFALSGRSS